MATSCVACGQQAEAPLLRFPGLPASGIYLDGDAQHVPRRDLVLSYCTVCGVVSQAASETIVHDYTAIDRGTAQQMPDYAADIVRSLRNAGLSGGSAILEVGSNDGSFLAFLAEKGFTRLKGLEPSRYLAGIAAAKGFDIETGYCTTAGAPALRARLGTFDAVVCRHTLEHVPDPGDLLASIAVLLVPGGLALIEVPDFDWVIEQLAVHEIWDEHVTYFARDNLIDALARHGFETLSCERIRFRDTRNLVALARATGQKGVVATAHRASTTAEGCAGLTARWHDLVDRLYAQSNDWPQPVYAIGASHIQSNFAHFAGLADVIAGFIDDDPRKCGKHVMLARPVPVIGTQEIVDKMRAGTVLRTAFPYPQWMDGIASAVQPRGVLIVDPYAGAPMLRAAS